MEYRKTKDKSNINERRKSLMNMSAEGGRNNGCVVRKYRMRKCRVIIKHREEVEAQIDRGVEQIWNWNAMNLHLQGTSQKRHCVYCGQIFTEAWMSTHIKNFHLRTLKKCYECGKNFRNWFNMKKHRKLCNGVC